MKGCIFAIEEMAIHDGPGLRTAVFFKGCPLRCGWCHNPEGLEPRPQRVKNPNGCIGCGACRTTCFEQCGACGKCLSVCPRGLLRISGRWWNAQALARRIRINEPFLRLGGVTVSGGEPLAQPEFLRDFLDALAPLHRAIETSGYAPESVWRETLDRLEMVYFDVKLVDPERHREYTGVSNAPILRNLEILKAGKVPFVIRIPLIEGVNDSTSNIEATSRLLDGAKNLMGVELLPFNINAGAKYALVGRAYDHSFRPPSNETLLAAREIFIRAGISATIR